MEVMKRLTAPDGCPWDRAQTHESIRVNLIEEAYEVVDAIDNGDTDNLIEELGDYLLQVVFHCDMATRDGEFTLCEVIDALVKKLVSRHTHIFGENKATDAESALGFWEKAKAKEKSYTTLTEQIERLPNSFSPLMRAGKISKKAVKSGADIDAIKLTEKIKNLVNGGINERNIGLLITYSAMLSSLLGVDCEVESNASVRKITETIEKAESENKLNQVSDKI